MNEVAVELGCDWHTVNDAVIAYGTVLVDDPARIGQPTALGLDETLFCRQGPWSRQCWSTSIVDVGTGRLLDVVAGRSAVEPCRWLAARGEDWLGRIAWATLDLSGPYRSVFDTMLPRRRPDRRSLSPRARAPRGAMYPGGVQGPTLGLSQQPGEAEEGVDVPPSGVEAGVHH